MDGVVLDWTWRRERAWLGYAGLTPFVAGAAIVLATPGAASTGWVACTLVAYAAVIASALGAVHWGAAAAVVDQVSRARLRRSVTPALVVGLRLTLPAPCALAGSTPLFGRILVVDHRLLPALDDGYRRLRLRLPVAVMLTLALAAIGAAWRLA